MAVNGGDYIRVNAEALLPDAGVAMNVYIYQASAGVSDTDANVMNAISNTMDAAYTLLNGVIDAQVVPTRMAFALSTDGGLSYNDIGERSWTNFIPAAAGDMLPPQDAFNAYFGASGTGRLGKKFLFGFAESESANGVVQASAFAAIANYIVQIVVASAVSGGTVSPGWIEAVTLAFRAYNATATVPTKVGSQRRRQDGVGI